MIMGWVAIGGRLLYNWQMDKREIYSLQRFVDGDGVPVYERVFDVPPVGTLERPHLNSELMKIIFNQPDPVKDMAREHLKRCQECREKYFPKEHKQGDLPLSEK